MATETKPKNLIIDVLTKNETQTVITDEQLVQREAEVSEYAAAQAEREAKDAARQSALAKLAELGLTEEEIAAL